MKTALFPTASPTVKLMPLSKQAPIHEWQEDLNFIEKEVAFYLKLLRMGVHNCTETSKLTIHRLHELFSNFYTQTITELRDELTNFDVETADSSMIYYFQRKMEAHFLNLRKLKESVFPQVHNMQRINFW